MDNSVQNLHKKKHISKQYDVFKIHHKPKEIFQNLGDNFNAQLKNCEILDM